MSAGEGSCAITDGAITERSSSFAKKHKMGSLPPKKVCSLYNGERCFPFFNSLDIGRELAVPEDGEQEIETKLSEVSLGNLKLIRSCFEPQNGYSPPIPVVCYKCVSLSSTHLEQARE